jgi:hypothetical protein
MPPRASLSVPDPFARRVRHRPNENKNSGGNSYGLRLRNGISLVEPNGNGDDSTENDKENGLKHGYNGNEKADILTFVSTGHFNFRLTGSGHAFRDDESPGRDSVERRAVSSGGGD